MFCPLVMIGAPKFSKSFVDFELNLLQCRMMIQFSYFREQGKLTVDWLMLCLCLLSHKKVLS